MLPRLAAAARGEGFYLAGGTAAALRLGHRRSVDFDWFRPEEIPDPLVFAQRLRNQGLDLGVTETERSTLHGRVSGVKTSFLSYPYPLLGPVEQWAEAGCPLVSLVDLGCMKLAAIGQRGARRDFIDLHAILGAGLKLSDLLDSYRRKYSVFDAGHVLIALTYFDDALREPMPEMLLPLDWARLQDDLRGEVRRILG